MDKSGKEPVVITATDASRSFSDLMHRVCYGGESFIIKKGHRMMARIVPVEADTHMAGEATLPQETQENPLAALLKPQSPVTKEVVARELSNDLTQEESDYYQTVVEQMRKTAFEPCE